MLILREQIMLLEQVAPPPDHEADVLLRRAVPPIEAKLVHVGDKPPPWLHRFVAE
jgi:hypothetical protein